MSMFTKYCERVVRNKERDKQRSAKLFTDHAFRITLLYLDKLIAGDLTPDEFIERLHERIDRLARNTWDTVYKDEIKYGSRTLGYTYMWQEGSVGITMMFSSSDPNVVTRFMLQTDHMLIRVGPDDVLVKQLSTLWYDRSTQSIAL